jgi:uncharacterized protein
MYSLAEIRQLCRRIAKDFHPERIILFGSHAYGKPTQDSDIDLFVVMPFEGRHTEQAIRMLDKLNVLMPLDLIVRTPEQVKERLALGDTFTKEILERGKVMYEANHA